MNIPSKYSAILTTYNCEDTIEDSIASILLQEIPPFELLIADDASTDKTVDILQAIQKTHVNITLLRTERNLGQSKGRNRCANLATTDYLVFYDDDDLSLKCRPRLHLTMFDNGSDLNFVSSKKNYDEKYSTSAINNEVGSRTFTFFEMSRYLLLGKKSTEFSFFVPSCTLAITKSAFLELDGFDEDLRRLEDADLAIRAAKNGLRFAFSSEVGVSRKFTTGIDKGGGIDAHYESILLEKYRTKISFWSYWKAKSWQKIRKDYFEKNWMSLIRFSLSNPLVWLQLATRMKSVIGRFRHDRMK